MFRTSISRLLITLQVLLLMSLLVATGILAIGGLSDYRTALSILDATQTDRVLFKTIITIRSQQSRVQGMLISADDYTAPLQKMRADVDAAYAGTWAPRLRALAPHIATYGLARADFHAVIDGMLMDAQDRPICAPPADTLDLYCDRVAAAVGRLSVRVFGLPADDGILLAHHLGRALQSALKVEGLTSEWLRRAMDAPSTVDATTVDCVLLDLTLPDGDGLTLCRDLRAEGYRGAIIMVTARDSAIDRVLGLELGADDYLTKPFEPRELSARIRILLRRAPRDTPGLVSPRVARFARWRLDLVKLLLGGHDLRVAHHEVRHLRRDLALLHLGGRRLVHALGHRGVGAARARDAALA